MKTLYYVKLAAQKEQMLYTYLPLYEIPRVTKVRETEYVGCQGLGSEELGTEFNLGKLEMF